MEQSDAVWFAMRATYGRNMIAQRGLEGVGIDSFVPTRKHTTKSGHRIKTSIVPIVRDLIFVHATKSAIQEAKDKMTFLHYITRPEGGRNTPIVIPEEQMQLFIVACNEDEENREFLVGEEMNIRVGDKVRILNGHLKGMEGHLVSIAKRRNRHFAIALEGLIAVTLTNIKPSDVEKIDK